MFGVIASSSGCKGPSHSSSNSNNNKHQSNHDNHQRRGSQDIKEKHHKDKDSRKYGVFSINQAIGTSMSCVGGSPQFVRELGVKASASPKT
ncbi:uncharacterized protein [Argopecten irradians]|uniref:uncharacterized protein isoform X2 n=1 Tax=Argopecten irradians TaxID=31199 RepID=UPI00371F425D